MSDNVLHKFKNLSEMINNTPMLEISLKYKGVKRKVYAKPAVLRTELLIIS